MLSLVHLEHMRELFAVQHLPGIFPAVGELGRLAVACGGVETELAGRGDGLSVEVGQAGREACGLRGC